MTTERMVIKADVRKEVGSKHAVKLRELGQIPAIVYGHKENPVAVSLNRHDFVEGLHHGHRLFDVKLKGKTETIMVKDLQYDHLGKSVIHADLVRVSLAEMVKVNVPIEIKGTSKGSHEGGIIDEHTDHIEVECKASDIPEIIPVSVKDLGVGDVIHASDVELPEGIKLASDPGMILLTCHLVAAAKSTEQLEEEMPVAPEVITERAEESEEEKEGKSE